MQHYFIINPAAGQGNAANYIPKIKECFQDKSENYTIYTTRGISDVTGYVRQIAENTQEELRFYACGGDGTLSEVVHGAVGFDHVSVGVLPAGTGNDFIRSFENAHLFQDINAQINGESVAIDLIQVNQQYSINMLNIGFDCNAAFYAAQYKKKIKGPLAYLAGVIREFCRKMGSDLTFLIDNEESLSGAYLLCTIANGSFCGGGFRSSPNACLSDGLMDIAIVKTLPRLRFLSILPSYRTGKYLGKHIQSGLVTYRQCKKLEIVSALPLNVCIDGEIFPFTSLKIKNLPKALRVIVPAGALMHNR